MERKRSTRTIPPEIVTEILYHLPAKSIGRFRCVSKDWLTQLTDPQFIKTHTKNSLNKKHTHLIFESPKTNGGSPSLQTHPIHSPELVITPTKVNLDLSYHNNNNYYYNNYNHNNNDWRLYIFGSCDGLVLVCATTYYYASCELFFLVNPTTKESFELPEHYLNFDDDDYVDLDTDYMYGFGYDSETDDYKVVILTYFRYFTRDDDEYDDAYEVDGVFVDVYSLRNNTWKRVVTDSPCNYSESLVGVFLNGFIHWIVSDFFSGYLAVIAAFSLVDECFSEVPSPKLCDARDMIRTCACELLVLGGKLAIFLRKKGEIWLMNEYGVRESWTKISLYGINKIPIFKPTTFTKALVLDDNVKILEANSDRMMVYEVDKRTSNEFFFVWDPKKLSVAGTYVETLVSPRLGQEEEENDDAEDESEEDDKEDESEEDDAEDENEEDDEDTSDDIRADLEFSGEKNVHSVRQTSKRKDIDSFNAPFEDYDSWKVKHREEKLRADRLEGELTHALSKQQLLTLRLEENEATIQSMLVEIQAFERRTREQGRALNTSSDEIESLKARLALADEERRKAIAALPEMVKNTMNSTGVPTP